MMEGRAPAENVAAFQHKKVLEQLESHRRRIQELEEQALKHVELKTKCQDLLNVTGRLWAQLNSNIIMLADRATCFLPGQGQGQLDSAGHSNGPVKTGALVLCLQQGQGCPAWSDVFVSLSTLPGLRGCWVAGCQLWRMSMPG